MQRAKFDHLLMDTADDTAILIEYENEDTPLVLTAVLDDDTSISVSLTRDDAEKIHRYLGYVLYTLDAEPAVPLTQ